MEVEITNESKYMDVYETLYHKFKISAEQLEKLEDKEDFELRLITKIQKGMRQKVKKINGEQWEESFDAIYNTVLEK